MINTSNIPIKLNKSLFTKEEELKNLKLEVLLLKTKLKETDEEKTILYTRNQDLEVENAEKSYEINEKNNEIYMLNNKIQILEQSQTKKDEEIVELKKAKMELLGLGKNLQKELYIQKEEYEKMKRLKSKYEEEVTVSQKNQERIENLNIKFDEKAKEEQEKRVKLEEILKKKERFIETCLNNKKTKSYDEEKRKIKENDLKLKVDNKNQGTVGYVNKNIIIEKLKNENLVMEMTIKKLENEKNYLYVTLKNRKDKEK